MNRGAVSVQVEANRLDRQPAKRDASEAFHLDLQHSSNIRRNTGRKKPVDAGDRRSGNADRPESHGITGAEPTELTVFRLAMNRRARRHLRRRSNALRWIELKLCDCL